MLTIIMNLYLLSHMTYRNALSISDYSRERHYDFWDRHSARVGVRRLAPSPYEHYPRANSSTGCYASTCLQKKDDTRTLHIYYLPLGRRKDMAITQNWIMVGVFQEHAQARQAIDDLRRAGFNDDEIGFLTRAGVIESPGDMGANVTTGAVSGGVIGGVVGAAVSLLIPGFGPALAGGILAATLGGAALGAAAGGIIGTFTAMGASEADAHFYQKELEAGRTVVTVKALNGSGEAEAILHRNGAYSVKTLFGAFNARPPLRPYGAPPDTYDPTTGSGTSEDVGP